jgi:hypothetical protein
LEKRLDSVILDDDLAALKELAVKGLLAELKLKDDDLAQAEKVLNGKSVKEAKAIIDLMAGVIKKAEPKKEKVPVTGTVPAPSTNGGREPGYFDPGYKHVTIPQPGRK